MRCVLSQSSVTGAVTLYWGQAGEHRGRPVTGQAGRQAGDRAGRQAGRPVTGQAGRRSEQIDGCAFRRLLSLWSRVYSRDNTAMLFGSLCAVEARNNQRES